MGEPAQVPKLKTTFKAILDEQDKASLFERAAAADTDVLIKVEGSSGVEATVYKAKKWNGTHLYADYVSGPALETAPVIVAFEVGRIWFCFTATVFISEENAKLPAAIDFDQGFEVQRREAHRVTIPDGAINAFFIIPTIKKNFRIIDLSEGGLGLALTEADLSLAPAKSVLIGQISIEGYDILDGLNAEVMHIKPEPPNYKAGCRFIKINLATRQRISFLVNACHRDVFGKLPKKKA